MEDRFRVALTTDVLAATMEYPEGGALLLENDYVSDEMLQQEMESDARLLLYHAVAS